MVQAAADREGVAEMGELGEEEDIREGSTCSLFLFFRGDMCRGLPEPEGSPRNVIRRPLSG